jgi:hypothetical protein
MYGTQRFCFHVGPAMANTGSKSRVGVGDVVLTENDWVNACSERGRYRRNVVFDCGTPNPQLVRVWDPFLKPIARAKGGVSIGDVEIYATVE